MFKFFRCYNYCWGGGFSQAFHGRGEGNDFSTIVIQESELLGKTYAGLYSCAGEMGSCRGWTARLVQVFGWPDVCTWTMSARLFLHEPDASE